MSCHDVAAALVDESLPRPPDFHAHLERCAECRTLARLHASATRLRLPEPPPLEPLPPQAIVREVRRRQRRRQAVAATAVAATLALLVPLVPTVTPRTQPPVSTPAALAQGEPASIGLLMREVYGYTRRDVVVQDPTYSAFGQMAVWLRPPEPTALNSRPFRTALLPLHPPEDER